MKNLINSIMLMSMLFFAVSSKAQTVDDIINKHINALGGKDKLLTLNSVKFEGNLNTQGYDISITLTRLNNKGFRLDFEIGGTSNYQIVTPDKGTSFMPVQGMSSPGDMPEEQFKSGQNQLDIQSPFLNYKEKGSKVELLGTEKVGDEDNYKLLVTFKNGLSTTYFIGSKNNLVNKTVSKRTVNGEAADLETTLSNYKQNADGYWFAYSSSGMQGDINFDTITTNLKIDESIFKP